MNKTLQKFNNNLIEVIFMSEDHKHVASLDPNKVHQRSSRSVSKQTDAERNADKPED